MALPEYRRSLSVTLSGAGNGSVLFEPTNANVIITIRWVLVMTNQGLSGPIPSAKVYRGEPSVIPGSPNVYPPSMCEGLTFQGNGDVLTGEVILDGTEALHVQWLGGPAGAVATANIRGTIEPVP